MQIVKTLILWLALAITCVIPASACAFPALENSIGHDASLNASVGYDSVVKRTFTYDEVLNHDPSDEVSERSICGQNAEFKAAETTATQLEFPFVNDLSGKPPIQWPPNGGFAGDPAAATLVPGATIDRFGLAKGTYVSPTGTPFIQRSLAPGTQYAPYNIYTVLQPIDVQAGQIAPAFGMPGGGIQFKMPSSVQSLIDSGHLGVGN